MPKYYENNPAVADKTRTTGTNPDEVTVSAMKKKKKKEYEQKPKMVMKKELVGYPAKERQHRAETRKTKSKAEKQKSYARGREIAKSKVRGMTKGSGYMGLFASAEE